MEDVLAPYRRKCIASHAYVERIEEGIVYLELRLTPIDFIPEEEKPKKWYNFLLKKKKSKKRFRYPRKMKELELVEISCVIPDLCEREVIVVKHIDGQIQSICYRDEQETQRRIARAEERRARLKEKMRKD